MVFRYQSSFQKKSMMYRNWRKITNHMELVTEPKVLRMRNIGRERKEESILILMGRKRQVEEIPATNARSPVEVQLEVEITDARVHFGAHEKVVHACATPAHIVRMRWKEIGLTISMEEGLIAIP